MNRLCSKTERTSTGLKAAKKSRTLLALYALLCELAMALAASGADAMPVVTRLTENRRLDLNGERKEPTVAVAQNRTVLQDASPRGHVAVDAEAVEWEQRYRIGQEHLHNDRFVQAERELSAAATMAERFHTGDFRLVTTLNGLGLALLGLGELSAAERILLRAKSAVSICEEQVCRVLRAGTLHSLALVHAQQNRFFDAERLLRTSLRLYRAETGMEIEIIDALHLLATLELHRNRGSAAERYAREALAVMGGNEQHVKRLNVLTTMAIALLIRGKGAEAERILEDVDRTEGKFPVESLVNSHCVLAARRTAARDFSAAEALLVRAEKLLQNKTTPKGEAAHVYLTWADLRYNQKQYEAAEAMVRKALALESIHWAPGHPAMLNAQRVHAAILRKLGRKKDAKLVENSMRSALRSAELDPAYHSVTVGELEDGK